MSGRSFKSFFNFQLLGDNDFRLFLRIAKSYLPLYKYKYLLIFVLIGVTAYATAMTAWLVRDVVNGLFVKKEGQFLIPLFLVIAGAFIVKGLATYWQSVLSANIANDMVARTQRQMFNHILAQRVSFFDRYSSDDLIMRMNQGAGAIGNILNKIVLTGARDAATAVSLVAVMVTQDLTLTLICLLVVPVIFLCISLLLKRIKLLMNQEMKSIVDLNKNTREVFQGVKVIKSYNLEPTIKQEVDGVIDNIKILSNRVAALQTAPVPIIDTLAGVGIGLTILYAGYRSIYGSYDPGTFLSFVTALLLVLDPVRRLSQMRVSLKTQLVSVGLVHGLLDDKQPEEEHPQSKSNDLVVSPEGALSIELQNVSFGYNSETSVLKDLDFSVQPGEMVALIGPSGAGKSTVFSLLLRFHRHQSGNILVGGHDIETLSVATLRDHISYVGQSNFIFSGTIRDNLTLKRPNIADDVMIEACKTVGLHDHIAQLPNGYDTAVGELGSQISGGQAQRLNIARAIIKDAPILLFDEVTSALDAENEELVRKYMHSQAGRKTILVIAHRLSTIRQADKIVLIESGRVKACGTHQDLIRGNDYYEKVAALQLIA